MRFFPVMCFFCLVGTSLLTASFASHWIDQSFMSSSTFEAFAFSRSFIELEMACMNASGGANVGGFHLNFAGILTPVVKNMAAGIFETIRTSMQLDQSTVVEPLPFSLRQYNIAFHPVYFDDMFSIDKRGNTLHFVDDATSIAKLSYPVFPAIVNSIRALLELLKLAIPVGINIAQSNS